MATGDVTGDGVDDALWNIGLVGFGTDTINFIPGGPNIFAPESDLAAAVRGIPIRPGTIFYDIAVADLDGDGFEDIVYGSPLLANGLGSDEVIILFGPFPVPAGSQQAAIGRLAVISADPDLLSLGFTVAAGDLTGDGRTDLAITINFTDADGNDSVAVVAGPFSARSTTLGQLNPVFTTAGVLGIADLGIGDVDLDGVNDLLIGRFFDDLVVVIPGRAMGPARFTDEVLFVGEQYTAATSGIAFGARVAVGDYDGDGLDDVLIGAPDDGVGARQSAGSIFGFPSGERGPAVYGVRPAAALAGSGNEIEIRGAGFLDATVVFRAADGSETEAEGTAESLGVVRATLPDTLEPGVVDVIVRTAIGEATLESALTVQPGTRTETLARAWNLVGWTGATAVEEAVAGISGEFAALFTWDAAAQSFQSFNPSGPAFLNTLTEVQLGDGVWINMTARGNWEQPVFSAARTVTLERGFNLAMWTGPDGTAVEEAVAALGDALEVLFTWDAAAQQFRRYSLAGPAFLNDATTLDFGDGVWLQVSRRTAWAQPAAAAEAVGPAVATSVEEAKAAVVLIDQGLGLGTGFVISDTEILTNAHVVGGAATVRLLFINGEERVGMVRASDAEFDVAVIQVTDLPEGVRRLDWETADPPAAATAVWAWGFPGGETFGPETVATVTTGIVSAIQTEEGFSPSSRPTRRSTPATAAARSSWLTGGWSGSPSSSSWEPKGRTSRST